MSSIIQGYEYDIFISYRQKDNKYDGWVTTFVDNLKRELEATFKEDVGVYFDNNPHDGLLETHEVDASLKEKIRCLVFIPIISNTYCDPKSFAWEHEFKTFIDLASHDQFGLKVKHPGGNITNRVLPVRIHDLDPEDIKLCESALGGVLRGVEFIFRQPGVNRPLKPSDDEIQNLNKTQYRNQINKVANAIKEIISGINARPLISDQDKSSIKAPWEKDETRVSVREEKNRFHKIKMMITGTITVLFSLLIIAFYVYPKLFKNEALEKLHSANEKLSIAVMPFRNLTNDTTWNIWQNAIQESLITSFSNTGEMRVRNKDNIKMLLKNKARGEYASLTPEIAGEVSGKLEADVFIYGSIEKSGSKMRIDAKLIDTKTGDILKPFEINGPFDENMVFALTDTLRNKVTNFLLISKMIKGNKVFQHNFTLPKSADALKYLFTGFKAWDKGDVEEARSWYRKSLEADSNFYDASFALEYSYGSQGDREESCKWLVRNFNRRDRMSLADRYHAGWAYEFSFGPSSEQIKYLQLLLELDDQDVESLHVLAGIYGNMGQFDKEIKVLEKGFEIVRKWGNDYLKNNFDYAMLGIAYHKTGQIKKEKMIYDESDKYSPDYTPIIWCRAVLALSENDTVSANKFIEKALTIKREKSDNEADIESNLGFFYQHSGMMDKAEEYYRKALLLEPEKTRRLEELANFFIDSNRNLDEVAGLMDKAMSLSKNRVDYYDMMNIKGWGLYKQGKTMEALVILQRCWNEAPYKLYSIRSSYEEVKKAVEGQK